MPYDKGDVVSVKNKDQNQVITQDHEGDQIDVIHTDEYGSVRVSQSSYVDGEVYNIIAEDDILEKVDEVELEDN